MRRVRIFLCSSLFISWLNAQDHGQVSHEAMHARHRDSSAYIAHLESPERDAYQKPGEVVEALRIQSGEVIADIGAGSGYFSFRLAQAVGPSGRVLAVDINPEMIRHLNRRVRESGVLNVVPHLSEPDDPLLVEGSIDRFFICDTWHHIEEPVQYLEHLRKALKPGGQLIMVDFKKEELPVGPRLEMKISREDLVAQMQANGFRVLEEHTFLPYQYFLVFSPAS